METVNDATAHNHAVVLNYIGNLWLEFSSQVPSEHIALYERGIATVLFAYPDSLMPSQIIELLSDETLAPEDRGMALRYVLLDQLVDIINKMGVTLNKDFVEVKHLTEFLNMAEFFYVCSEIEDAYNTILPMLLASDNAPKYRLIGCLGKAFFFENEDPDVSEYECLIDDVAESTLKALADAITQEDTSDIPPDSVIQRLKANQAIYGDTLAYQYVRKGGSLCNALETYLNYFRQQLSELLNEDGIEYTVQYGKDIIALHLISDLNNSQIIDKLLTFFDGRVDNIAAVFQIEKLVKTLVLTQDPIDEQD